MNGESMNKLSQILIKLTLLLPLTICCMGITATAQTARLQLGQLDNLAPKASETVDINVDERLIQLTVKFFGKDPDEEEIKKIISGLKGIYVRSFEFEKDGEYSEADIDSIRTQLRNPSWSKILNVTSKKEGTVEVYVSTGASGIDGLAVLAAEAKELTVVNIIGPVDLEKLSKLEGQFGVPDFEIVTPSKPKQKN
jgi:Domain of unknown function (DUF4252)